MKIDHIGYAVKKIEQAKASFESLGFCFYEPVYEDADRNIYIQFGEKDGYRIELVAPLGNGESPVDTVLRTVGSTPYHFCYQSEDIENDIAELEKKRFKIIIPLAEAIAFGGRRVAFMMNVGLGLIENVEAPS